VQQISRQSANVPLNLDPIVQVDPAPVRPPALPQAQLMVGGHSPWRIQRPWEKLHRGNRWRRSDGWSPDRPAAGEHEIILTYAPRSLGSSSTACGRISLGY
jgi:hypothetical protein